MTLALPNIYPGYIAQRIKAALRSTDPESVITSVGQIETLSLGRYAITVTDFNGSQYRVTVEPFGRAEV
jgi:hypothetical protein